jgi:hypothetical protein
MAATIIPGLALLEGIPPQLRTMIVVPTLLTTPASVQEQIERLEIHYLASPDGDLHFALLSDWIDAPTEHTAAKERSLSSYYDDVALKGLQLAQADLDRDVLDVSRLLRIRDTVIEFTDDLADQTDQEPIDGQATNDVEAVAAVEQVATEPAYSDLPVLQAADLKPEWASENSILCIAGRTPLDEAAAIMMSHLCKVHGLSARVEGSHTLSTANIFGLDVTGVALVCLSYLNSANPAHMRYAVRRLRRKVPRAKIVLAVWSDEKPDVALDSAKADAIVVSLREAVCLCIDEASAKHVIEDIESPIRVALNSA